MPYQLIQILVFICTSSKEINQQTPSEKNVLKYHSYPYKPSAVASRVSFSVRPLALPTYPIPQSFYENPRTKKINNFYPFPYKLSAVASHVSFSVRPPALETYSIFHSCYENPNLKINNFHPFPYKPSAMASRVSFCTHTSHRPHLWFFFFIIRTKSKLKLQFLWNQYIIKTSPLQTIINSQSRFLLLTQPLAALPTIPKPHFINKIKTLCSNQK